MEFFEWMGITQAIFAVVAGIFLKEDTLELAKRNARLSIIAGLAAGAALFALCLILGGFGLYKMAKKKGKKYAWLAFIPFANTFYAGYIAGEARFFGQKMKRAGLYAMLAEILYVALNVLSLVADILMIPYYTGTTEISVYGEPYTTFGPTATSVPHSLRWLYDATYANGGFGWAYIVNYAVFIVFLVFLGVTLAALFKQYSPRGYAGLMVLCLFFPVRGFVYFSLRNRNPVDYNAWMRQRMEEYARRQQQYDPHGPYSGPYDPYGQNRPPYGQNPYGQQPPQSPPQEEPFSDFGGGSGQGGNTQGGADSPPPADDNPFSDF